MNKAKRHFFRNHGFVIISACLMFAAMTASGQYGGTPPPDGGSAPAPQYTGDIEFRMVNLSSPWNFMDFEWPGYKASAQSPNLDYTNTMYPYPYWDFEKDYLKALVRSLKTRNVNTIRILASRPIYLCHDAINNLTNTKTKWWCNVGDYGNMFGLEFQNNPGTTFQDPDYLSDTDNWDQSNPNKADLQGIKQCWTNLLGLLCEIRAEFVESNEPQIKVVLAFDLGRFKGHLPILPKSQQSAPVTNQFEQKFQRYWSGSNWLYFKTFYDACQERINSLENQSVTDVDSLLDYLNVVIVEVQNEGDNGVLRYDANQHVLYPTPQSTPLPQFYYETNAILGTQPPEEKNCKRSVEGLKELLDWADMVITDSNWLGISEDKISYGFTSPETMKLITYNNDQQDPKYRYRILSWHSYSSLFIQGLGPQVDWVRSTMNGWSDKNYSIIIGEAGFNYDYNLSDFWSGTLNNNPPDLEAYPVYGHPDLNYYDYDTVTNSGYHYIKTWLQEAEYFSTTPRVNIWTPESSNVVPLKGLGLWASTDCQLITGNYNCLMRWGLFETFDTAFRLPETYTLPSWYCYPSRTKRDLIAPMARQAVRAVREVWKEDQTGTYSTWKAGDMLENPILIAPYSLLNLTFFNRTAGTPETVYSIQDRTNDTIPDIPFTDSNGDKTYVNSPSCFPAQHPSGGDVWFKTTILGNIGCCWISCVAFRTQGLSNPKVVAAVYRKEGANLVELACDSSEEGTLIDISGGDGGTGTRDIYYYLWVEDPGPNASVSLDVNIYVD